MNINWIDDPGNSNSGPKGVEMFATFGSHRIGLSSVAHSAIGNAKRVRLGFDDNGRLVVAAASASEGYSVSMPARQVCCKRVCDSFGAAGRIACTVVDGMLVFERPVKTGE
jgi:hypothetical protein